MSNKQNIMLHLDGINACESKDFEHALKLFMRISEPSAPILFNIGCCYLKLNSNSEALKMFRECVTRDKYLAIGHFQLAVAQTLCGDLTSAAIGFQDAFKPLRGNPFIDYKQLNMSCKLYASEVNFNLGLVYLFCGDYNTARDYIRYAGGLQTDSARHAVIPAGVEAAEWDRWEYFGKDVSERLITLPGNSFFRVSKAKMEGLQTSTKFMDQAKVVAAVNDDYDFVGFVGAKKLQPANNNAGLSVPTAKRSNPAVGLPPSMPPPRLPPGLSSPVRNVPNKSPTASPGRTSPARHSSPSRPPPPSAPPPKVGPKSSPSRPPPALEKTPVMATGRSSPASGGSDVVSELRKTMENARFKPVDTPSDKPSRAPYTKVVKVPKLNDVQNKSQVSQPQVANLNCEFNVTVPADVSYDELATIIAEKLRQASLKLSNPLQRNSMILSLRDSSKKSEVAVMSNSSFWQTTWSSMMKNRQSEPVLMLKESENDSYQRGTSSASPTNESMPFSSSPGYKPSRPAPCIVQDAQEEESGEDIYHDIS